MVQYSERAFSHFFWLTLFSLARAKENFRPADMTKVRILSENFYKGPILDFPKVYTCPQTPFRIVCIFSVARVSTSAQTPKPAHAHVYYVTAPHAHHIRIPQPQLRFNHPLAHWSSLSPTDLRERRAGQVDHFLRGRRDPSMERMMRDASFNHLMRGKKAVDHLLR